MVAVEAVAVAAEAVIVTTCAAVVLDERVVVVVASFMLAAYTPYMGPQAYRCRISDGLRLDRKERRAV